MGDLSKLPNIGKVLERQLNDVGINTEDDLINIGSKECDEANYKPGALST
ncbi:TfoX/Sxy family DNA transformation protein [Methanobrevibacter millerae]|uniref:TfoX C-terminal domain-containing protein n=1 Tax=Methanobrevibacter millerae TaxID=230361 RepID=A0A1G5X3J2_9EURY|nr:TfoX/Sxy family DNA transformation protein [Methanobrevibacter millerae]SDA64770.1 TfoX C-terminal domain-containing protein [Methanobrevibacter millerae]